MLPFRFQVIAVAHHSLGAIQGAQAGLFKPPSGPMDQDYAGLQKLIADARAGAVRRFRANTVNALEGKDVIFQLGPNKLPFTAEGFLMSFSLPNLHFHATTAYDILRMKGAPLGKRDYMGRAADEDLIATNAAGNTMLNKLDDYPIHQTPEPLAHPATSDRNVYDRTWFNGYAPDGSYYFGIGMAVYPHRGHPRLRVQRRTTGPAPALLLRFAARAGGTHRHAGRAVPDRRGRTAASARASRSKTTRAASAANWSFRRAPARFRKRARRCGAGTRRAMDATRFDQFGRWSGWVKHPEGTITRRRSGVPRHQGPLVGRARRR